MCLVRIVSESQGLPIGPWGIRLTGTLVETARLLPKFVMSSTSNYPMTFPRKRLIFQYCIIHFAMIIHLATCTWCILWGQIQWDISLWPRQRSHWIFRNDSACQHDSIGIQQNTLWTKHHLITGPNTWRAYGQTTIIQNHGKGYSLCSYSINITIKYIIKTWHPVPYSILFLWSKTICY